MDVHTFALDRAIELVLATWLLVVVSRRMSSLDTLWILRSVGQGKQLLLKFRRNIYWGEVCTLASDGDLVIVVRWAEENALLRRLVGLIVGCDTAGIAGGWVDREGAIYIATSLVEFNCLPSIFGSLTDSWTVLNSGYVWLLLILLATALDIPFDLILTEPKWQVELERVVLATLWFLESISIGSSCSRTAISRPSRIRRAIVVWRPVCCRSGSRREERGFCAGLVGCLIHLVLDVSWFSDRISKLDN